MLSKCCCDAIESSIHVFMVFTIQHVESLSFITKGIIPIPSHAFIPNKEIGEGIPSFFSCVEMFNVGHVLGTHTELYHVESRSIQLAVHNFSSCQIGMISNMKTLFHNPPKCN